MIRRNHGISERQVLDKVIALEVELSEFANEVRFFKFWSNKEMDREKALTEYVDALHFFLSLANDFNIDFNMGSDINDNDYSLKICYSRCKKWVLDILDSPEPEKVWQVAFSWFWAMGEIVGFTEQEVFFEYIRKNKINHERQESGY